MVEELKLAIKVDDDAIEQSLLKQFANAEKMANKVVLTFNNIDLDDKAIEAKFKEMQKMAGKNPIDLSIDKSSIEMLSAISKQLGNIFDIAKGKSIIDSSATVSDVNKITQSTNQQIKAVEKVTSSYKNQAYELASILKMLAKLDGASVPYAENLSKAVKASASTFKDGNSIQFAALKNGFTEEMLKYLRGFSVNLSGAFNYSETLGLDTATISNVEELITYFRELLKTKIEFNNTKLNTADIEELIKALGILKKEHFDDGTKTGRNIYGDGSLDKYSDISEIRSYLKQQEEQAIATAQAEQKLADAEKEVGKSSIAETQNKIQEELKETQKQAEQTSEALSNIADGNKSNISSGNSIRSVLPSDSEFKNVIANLDLTKSKLGEIVKITRQAHADKDGKFYESFTLTDRNGSTETYGESSKTSKGQLLNYKYVEQNAKAAEQEAKALNQAWEEANKVNNALNETKNTLSSLPRMTELDTQFTSLDAKLSNLNSELTSGKISVADYKKEVKSLTSEYSKLVTIQQNRDVETYKQNTKAAEQEAKAVKEVWDKNVKAIQDYMDANTKLNNLNAKDKGTGKYASQIALQEKNVEELKEKALEARTAITSMINPHDVPLNTWRDYLDVMEKFSQASLGSAESVAKLEDALRKMDFSSLESSGTKFKSQFKNLSIKPDGDHQFLSWKNDLNELNAKIDEYNSKVKYLKENNIVDGKQVDEVKELRDEIEKAINTMTKTPQTKRGWTDIGASKAAEKVANVLKQNTKMSKEAKDAIRAYYNELRSGNPSQPIDEILVKVNQLVQKERELGRVGKSFREIFKEKVIYGGAAQLAGMVGFYDVINVIRQAGEAVIDLNTNITELAKVSEASVSQIYDDFNSYADIAKEVGGTISDTISATADWSRNGYNIPDAKELAEVAMIYKNVGDGIDIDQANEYLISTLRGFSLEAKDAMDIIDSINEVANNEPISSAGIGEALQRSAAAFNVANTSLQESIALVTSTNSVLQSPEKVGSMWTTVSARIRGAKTELEDAGLETDGMVESTSKLQSLIKGMTGFDILEDDQKTFKSIYDIIIGIGEEFQNLSGVDQAALLEALAGGVILPENMETYLMNIFNCKVNLKLYATI